MMKMMMKTTTLFTDKERLNKEDAVDTQQYSQRTREKVIDDFYYCYGIDKEDDDDSNDNEYNKIKASEYYDSNSDGKGDNADDDNKEEEDEDKEDEYYDTKPYNDQFLEAMYNTERFREQYDVVDKTGEWAEEFR